MSYRPRSRSPDPRRRDRDRDSYSPSRSREYSPSRGVDYGRDDYPPPPPHRRDDRPPLPRRYDDSDDRIPPPRRYDDRAPRRYDDDDRRPPPRRYEDERGAPRRDDRAPRRDDRRAPRDRERDEYDDRRYRDRASDREYERHERRHDDERRRGHASEPSRDVIFLGLDPALTEDALLAFLRAQGAAADSAKVVRDKFTGDSKLFGFVQFASVPDAVRFMDAHAPTLPMPALRGGEARRVKIDYAGNKEERERGGGGGGAHAHAHASAMQVHDGTRDIGAPGAGQRVLLVRGLDAGTYVGEVTRRFADEIARMLGKDVRTAETAITRVVMITDRQSEQPWCFAFVELVSPELAAALLPFLITPATQPSGFLIAQVPVAVSFANLDAFVPVPAGPLGSEFLVRAAPNGGIGANTLGRDDGEWVGYWHEGAGAVQSAPRGALPIPERGQELELPQELCEFLGSLSGRKWVPPQPTSTVPVAEASGVPAPVATHTAGTASAGPIKISFGKKAKKEPKPEDAMVTIMSKRIGDEEEIDLIGKDSVLLSRTKGAKIIPPTSTSSKVMKNISKWNTKQGELAAPDPPSAKKKKAEPALSSANAIGLGAGSGPAQPTQAEQDAAEEAHANLAALPADEKFDYTDTSQFKVTLRVSCLLCQRQFKTEDVLRKHCQMSDLHKTNLQDASTREAGKRRKLAIAGALEAGDYRDRAKERRKVFHQPDRVKWPQQYPHHQPAPKNAPAPAAPAKEAEPETVGNKLLAKMGWADGQGLGKAGDGRAAPIQVQQFAERAGLGTARGRDTTQSWQDQKKDLTKERYEDASKS